MALSVTVGLDAAGPGALDSDLTQQAAAGRSTIPAAATLSGSLKRLRALPLVLSIDGGPLPSRRC